MHIGFRYHIASLVAVFFSLFLGILIGSVLFQDDRLVREQGHIIHDLENQFRLTEARIQVLQNNLRNYESREQLVMEGWDQIRKTFVKDRLVGTSSILLAKSASVDWSRIEGLLRSSGSIIEETLVFKDDWEDFFDQYSETKRHERGIAIVWVDESIADREIEAIESTLTAKGWEVAFLQNFQSERSIPFSGNSLHIDIADTLIGELALVQALSQSVKGWFGARERADSLLPQLDLEVLP